MSNYEYIWTFYKRYRKENYFILLWGPMLSMSHLLVGLHPHPWFVFLKEPRIKRIWSFEPHYSPTQGGLYPVRIRKLDFKSTRNLSWTRQKVLLTRHTSIRSRKEKKINPHANTLTEVSLQTHLYNVNFISYLKKRT